MSIWWIFNTLWLPWPAAFCNHWKFVPLLYMDHTVKGLSCGENCNVRQFSVWAYCISLFTNSLFVPQTHVLGLENSTLKIRKGRGEIGPVESNGAECTFLQDAKLFQLSLFQKAEWSQGSITLAFLLSFSQQPLLPQNLSSQRREYKLCFDQG